MGDEQVRRIEAEMAKFEREIGNRPPQPQQPAAAAAVPPVPPIAPPGMFVPHSIRMRAFAPPPMGMPPMPPPPFGAMPPMFMPRPHGRLPFVPLPMAAGGGGDARPAEGKECKPAAPPPATGPVISAPSTPPQPQSQPHTPPVDLQQSSSSSAAPTNRTTASGSGTTMTALASDIAAMETKRQQEVQAQRQIAVAGAWKKKAETSRNPYLRFSGGEMWVDHNLAEWDPNDFRLFCGDLGNEVNDELLAKTFRRYPSFMKAKVVRDKKNGKSRGFGFVSFKNPEDFIRAMREMNGKYVGNHPIKLKKSDWKDRQYDTAVKKHKTKKKLGLV